jgi:hypothetical protein
MRKGKNDSTYAYKKTFGDLDTPAYTLHPVWHTVILKASWRLELSRPVSADELQPVAVPGQSAEKRPRTGRGHGDGALICSIQAFRWADVVVDGGSTELRFENRTRLVVSDGIVQYVDAGRASLTPTGWPGPGGRADDRADGPTVLRDGWPTGRALRGGWAPPPPPICPGSSLPDHPSAGCPMPRCLSMSTCKTLLRFTTRSHP